MNHRTLLPLALGSLVCASAAPAEETPPRMPPASTRVYTNEDLDRVRPFRDELGASSVPAVSSAPASGESAESTPGARGSGKPTARDEAYWRREAEKLRERLRVLADKRDALRMRLGERREEERRVLRRSRGSRAAGDRSDVALEAQIAAIERRMRELEEDLGDRARRAGAMPGWLR